MIVRGNIESLPNSAAGVVGWLRDTYIEIADMLFNYIHILRTVNWKDISKASLIFFLIASET